MNEAASSLGKLSVKKHPELHSSKTMTKLSKLAAQARTKKAQEKKQQKSKRPSI